MLTAICCLSSHPTDAFSSGILVGRSHLPEATTRVPVLRLAANNNDDDRERLRIEEESRLNILASRRSTIRSTLRAAEVLKNFRIEKGFLPELDDDGKPKQSDSKMAVAFTAFAVAGGAVALRIGGRAALASAVGLDFANDNPQLKEQLDNILNFAASMDTTTEALLFVLAWTACKVLLFDAGGVALALSAGILFGGVLQGALFSAFAATVGSAVCFALAKLDTPLRSKALEAVEQNPSLRGIEKVVAKDGFKAILVLRLAPVLPVPLGLYNYIYAVTGVPFFDFASGIFLGSLKPYLLDSYLGYFGKSVIDGTAATDPSNTQDIILLLAIGLSVLIGVFASQLAAETWDTVLKEVDDEAKASSGNATQADKPDGIVRELLGVSVPEWIVGFQLQLAMANERVNELIDVEVDAKVWNYTKAEIIPSHMDPALAPDSPEMALANTGFDFAGSTCDSLVLSPILTAAFLKYADPLLNVDDDRENRPKSRRKFRDMIEEQGITSTSIETALVVQTDLRTELLQRVVSLRDIVQTRLANIERLLEEASDKEK